MTSTLDFAPSTRSSADVPGHSVMPSATRRVEIMCGANVGAPQWAAALIDEGIEVVSSPLGPPPEAGLDELAPDARVLCLSRPLAAQMATVRAWSEAAPQRPLLVAVHGLRELDHVLALEIGADDVIDVTAAAIVIAAKLRAIWRRADRAAPPTRGAGDVLRYGGLEIDRARQRVRLDERPVELTEAEFDLLWRLASHPGRAMSRAELMLDVPATSAAAGGRCVDSRVYRVRMKLGDTEPDGQRLRTVRRHGYLFTPTGW